jgi:Predicted integral membrane protein
MVGQAYLCTRDHSFTIRGPSDCLARGYDRTGFFEVDTGGEQRAWTVQLIESSEQSSKTFAQLRHPSFINAWKSSTDQRDGATWSSENPMTRVTYSN